MSFIKKGLLGVNPLFYETRRFRGKVNLKRPQLPHFTRQVTLDVCKPIYPPKPHVWEVCKANYVNPKKRQVENPFENILAKECLNWFNHSSMVIFLHLNPIKMEYKYPILQELTLTNMHIRKYNKRIIDKALTGTNYEICAKLFVSQNEIIFSKTVQPKKLLDILRKVPQLILMAAIVDGKLLSKNEFIEYSKLPSIDILRSQLCNIMQSTGTSVVNQLSLHQSILVGHLDNYAKIQQEANKPNIVEETVQGSTEQ